MDPIFGPFWGSRGSIGRQHGTAGHQRFASRDKSSPVSDARGTFGGIRGSMTVRKGPQNSHNSQEFDPLPLHHHSNEINWLGVGWARAQPSAQHPGRND